MKRKKKRKTYRRKTIGFEETLEMVTGLTKFSIAVPAVTAVGIKAIDAVKK